MSITTKTMTYEGMTGLCPICDDDVEIGYEIVAQRDDVTGITSISVEGVPWEEEHECEGEAR